MCHPPRSEFHLGPFSTGGHTDGRFPAIIRFETETGRRASVRDISCQICAFFVTDCSPRM